MTTDRPSEYVLVAFNHPSAIRVYRINRDATLGEEVPQPGSIDAGIFAHQVRVTDNNRLAILVTRGNDPVDGKPEDPGALKVFHFTNGQLTNEVSVAPNGGYGFGPRHVDFHPTQPWVYVSLERENKLDMFTLDGDTLSPVPRFRKETMARPHNIVSRQAAGTVHVHPNGRVVYGVNRADTTTELEGQQVFVGGENTIATYLINQETGEPTLIDHTETHGIHCRTFHIDPSGRLLVAAHIRPLLVKGGGERASCAGVPVGVPHRQRRHARLRAQVRRRCRQEHDVLDGDGAAVGHVDAARRKCPVQPLVTHGQGPWRP